jgi:hypothetical protein
MQITKYVFYLLYVDFLNIGSRMNFIMPLGEIS